MIWIESLQFLCQSSSFVALGAVSLCGVAGLTFLFLPVSGPFLRDLPGFHVPSDSVLPSQHWSSYRALPFHLNIGLPLGRSPSISTLVFLQGAPRPSQHWSSSRALHFHLNIGLPLGRSPSISTLVFLQGAPLPSQHWSSYRALPFHLNIGLPLGCSPSISTLVFL